MVLSPYNNILIHTMPPVSELEGNINPEKEKEKEIIFRISLGVLRGEITDDNPICLNGPTSLDQVIIYEFGLTVENFLEKKRAVIDKVSELQEEGEQVESMDEFDEEIIDEIAYGMYVGEITDDNPSPKNGLSSLEQIICHYFFFEDNEQEEFAIIKNMIYERLVELQLTGCMLEENEDDDDTQEYEVEVVQRIARGIIKGEIGDNNPSPKNGLTSLEQILQYEFGASEQNAIERTRLAIFSRVIDLRGGSSMTCINA